jgi:hypothetical protein
MDYTITYRQPEDYTDSNVMGEIGVARGGTGTIKYLPVVWGRLDYGRIQLLKTRIRSIDSAREIYENLVLSCQLRTSTAESIELCEHALKYGRAHRY